MAATITRYVYKVSDLLAPWIAYGSGGTPNAVITAPQGSQFIRTDGNTFGTIVYVNTDGGTTWAVASISGTDFGAGGIKTDVIVESTGAAGVTVEGVWKFEDGTIETTAIPVSWTHTATHDADDATIAVAGAFDASLVLSSAGTGTDAIKMTASAGGIDVNSAAGLDVDVTGAIALDASGAFGIESSAGAIGIGTNAVAQNVNVATGGARTLNLGSAAAAGIVVNAGTGLLNVDATTVEVDATGAVSVESSGGAISIGADAVAQAVNIATGGAARPIAIGNAASASLTMEAGVGAATIDADGVVELNSSAAAISIGNDNVAQAINIGTAGARPINIGSAAANGIVFDSGVGGINVDADTTIDIDAAGAITIDSSAASISIGADAVAQAVNIATGAAARAILIGNAASASLGLDAGVGAGSFVADTTLTLTAGTTSTWSVTGNDAGNLTLTIDSINAGAGNGLLVLTADNDVTLGDAAGNPTLTLSGTGNVIVGTSKVVANAAAEVLNFHDDVLQIVDPADVTKIVRVDAGNVTAGNTRVLTMADRAIDIADLDVVSLGDVGTGNAIPVTDSVTMNIVTGAGAETNTLDIPTFAGQTCSLHLGVAGGGTRTVTVATAINQAGNTQIAFTQALDFIHLVAVRTVAAGTLAWRVVVNDGCVLA